MYYHFHQNNSGGAFANPYDIIVEADSPEEANEIAQRHGVYFDGTNCQGVCDEEWVPYEGCYCSRDCPCCGDRWYRVSEWDAHDEIPEVSFFLAGSNAYALVVHKNKPNERIYPQGN